MVLEPRVPRVQDPRAHWKAGSLPAVWGAVPQTVPTGAGRCVPKDSSDKPCRLTPCPQLAVPGPRKETLEGAG